MAHAVVFEAARGAGTHVGIAVTVGIERDTRGCESGSIGLRIEAEPRLIEEDRATRDEISIAVAIDVDGGSKAKRWIR